MYYRHTIMVTDADDAIVPAVAVTSGPHRHGPILRLGTDPGASVELHIAALLLTPAEQAAWLERLEDAARFLRFAVLEGVAS